MQYVRDAWLIRLPSGQELRAKSTKAVLHHIESGVIPRASLVRRAPDQEWKQMDWTLEFSAALERRQQSPVVSSGRSESSAFAGIASRLDPLRLRTVGVRGIWEDLVAALDSTFVRAKLRAAAGTATLIALLLAVMPWLVGQIAALFKTPVSWSPGTIREATALLCLFPLACLNGLLARMTHIELSNMRPCRPGEAERGLFRLGFRLLTAYFMIVAVAGLIAGLLRVLPAAAAATLTIDWGLPNWLGSAAHTALAGIGVAVEIALWFAVGLTWLLAPIMVVDDCDVFVALRSWCRLLARHASRVLLAEALTLTAGVLIALPFAAPVWLALAGREFVDNVAAADAIRYVAWALPLTPLLAFLGVANLFIYLDLRFEQER